MPNEINKDKNLIQFNNEIETTGVDQKKNRRPLRATGGTIFVWTISGIVLAACEGSSRMGLDGVDGGPTDVVPPPPPTPAPTPPKSVKVIDGPVRGAKIYFDMNGDGKIDAADRAAQMAKYPDGFVTNEHGEVEIPDEFVGKIFLADVDGAIDTANKEPLEGQYYSLPTGEIATPITDFIVRSIQEGKGEEARDVVRKILTDAEQLTGTDEENDREVEEFLAKILNPESYQGGQNRDRQIVYITTELVSDKERAHEIGDDEAENIDQQAQEVANILKGGEAGAELVIPTNEMIFKVGTNHDGAIGKINALKHSNSPFVFAKQLALLCLMLMPMVTLTLLVLVLILSPVNMRLRLMYLLAVRKTQ
jgi:hypothetical protein